MMRGIGKMITKAFFKAVGKAFVTVFVVAIVLFAFQTVREIQTSHHKALAAQAEAADKAKFDREYNRAKAGIFSDGPFTNSWQGINSHQNVFTYQDAYSQQNAFTQQNAYSQSGKDTWYEEFYVTTASVNLRKGPGTEYDVIETLEPGVVVCSYSEPSDGWVLVLRNGQKGWVSSNYLR